MYFLRNMRNLALVMGPVMLFVFVYSNFIQKPKQDNVTFVGAGDPAMAKARDQGRATLPDFLRHLESPAANETKFTVKFRLDPSQAVGVRPASYAAPGDEPAEFIWASRLNLSDDGKSIGGFISGDPRMKGFHNGQPVWIPIEDVVDWGYMKGGVMQGGFTTKVLLEKLSPSERAEAEEAMGWR